MASSKRNLLICGVGLLGLIVLVYILRAASGSPDLEQARQMADRTPVLSLEGTDLTLLAEAIDRLAAAQETLAGIQKTERSRRAVAHALFPVAYLRSLVTLEESRRGFVARGEADSYETYARARAQAFKEGLRALDRFERGYRDFAGGSYDSTVALAGKLNTKRTLEVISEIRVGYKKTRSALASEPSCAEPATECLSKEIAASPSGAAASTQSMLFVYQEGLRLGVRHATVALERSACIPNESPVLIFSPSFSPERLLTYLYVGDIFFNPLEWTDRGEVVGWFKNNGVENLIYNPLTFYTCPDVGVDISRTEALSDMAAKAGLTGKGRMSFSEREIIKAVEGTLAKSYSAEMERLYRGYREGSAGFEQVVGDVAHGLESLLSMRAKGIPVDYSAEFLFSTHSGYYSLFMAHNRTTGVERPSPYAPDANNSFFKRFLRYSEQRDSVDSASFMRDASAFLESHL